MTVTSFARNVVGAGVVLLAAGCGGSSEGAGTSSPSSTPATSSSAAAASTSAPATTSTAAASSTGGSMAEKYPETPAGAEAFVRAFFGAYNTASQDPSKLAEFEAMSAAECASCQALKGQIRGYEQKDARAEGPSANVTVVKHDPNPNRTVVLAGINQVARNVRTVSGEVVSNIPAAKQNVALTLTRSQRGWEVSQIERYLGEL